VALQFYYDFITFDRVSTKTPSSHVTKTLKTNGKFGGGGRTRTYDLRIMSQISDSDSKENQQLPSAESGKVLQNPQPRRNKK
jgi:hypothetical protein